MRDDREHLVAGRDRTRELIADRRDALVLDGELDAGRLGLRLGIRESQHVVDPTAHVLRREIGLLQIVGRARGHELREDPVLATRRDEDRQQQAGRPDRAHGLDPVHAGHLVVEHDERELGIAEQRRERGGATRDVDDRRHVAVTVAQAAEQRATSHEAIDLVVVDDQDPQRVHQRGTSESAQ